MKESLEILGVKSSGLEDIKKIGLQKKNDENILSEIEHITDPEEKEKYLKQILDKKPHGFVKLKLLLAERVKDKDLKKAFELIMSASLSAPTEIKCYLLLAKVASENKAWTIAKNACEIIKWLCSVEKNTPQEILVETEDLAAQINEKIASKEYDSSQNNFWISKNPDKFWILEKLYFQSKIKDLKELCYKLLELFPENTRSYEVVYKTFVLIDDKEAFDRFKDYIERNLVNDQINRNLFLGMIQYNFLNFSESLNYLKAALKSNPLDSKILFYIALNHLMTNNVKEFVRTSEMILPESEAMFIALYFIFSAATNTQLDKIEFPNHKNIAREASLIFEKLLKCGQANVVTTIEEQFKKLEYNLILPCWQLYLAEIYIKHNLLDKAKKVLEGCKDSDIHRINAWIYRLEGNNDLAESELKEYRQLWKPESETGFYCQMVNLKLPEKSPDNVEEIFKHLKDGYKQIKEIINQLELEYGLNDFTCIETGCQDCCKRTFPQLTYTEYLYMRHWFEKQPDEYKEKVTNDSVKIVNTYKEEFKKEPPFMAGDVMFNQHYPVGFTFDCPYLGDNKCNAYDARPFGCRGYGYSSHDGITFKGCNFFYEQFKAATKLHHIRKVVSAASFFDYARLTDEELIGKKVMAPIPVWFAQSHEETLKKVKEAIANSETMALSP